MKTKTLILFALTIILTACKNDPKVIEASTNDEGSTQKSGIFSDDSHNHSNETQTTTTTKDLHTVVVNEVLPAEKYVYLNVTENNQKFWIAARKMDAKVGETYFYKGGLLKTNFESKEYNRVFDKIYLVSSLVSANHSKTTSVQDIKDYSNKSASNSKEDIPTHTEKIVEHKGSIKIAELVKDPKKYEGKTVQVSGVCTKINAGIMDRNWIHIKDGSKDDFDLVITSQTFIPEGKTFTMKALVTLNKDFGAGYKYDLILENGTLVE